MRSRHATVSQLAVKGVGSQCRARGDVGAVGAGGKGGRQTCERLVIRRPHHAEPRRAESRGALKQRRARLMAVANTVVAAATFSVRNGAF